MRLRAETLNKTSFCLLSSLWKSIKIHIFKHYSRKRIGAYNTLTISHVVVCNSIIVISISYESINERIKCVCNLCVDYIGQMAFILRVIL